jgi:hypothetical protein
MAVPQNTWTPTPVVSDFLPPIDDPFYDPLFMRATGGVAIGDGSQGREVQFWSIYLSSGNVISIQAENSGTPGYELAITDADVLSVCLAFDSNMAVAIAYQTALGSHLYFFNGVHNAYETITISDGASCRIAVDKTTQFFNAQSDVIFIYANTSNEINYRIQRDRYTIDYPIAGGSAGQTLVRFGPALDNRLQVQLLPIFQS